MDVQSRIKELFVQQLKVTPEKVVPEASIKDDLGADSLDATEIIIALERTFEITIPDDEALQFLTVGHVIQYIERRLSVSREGIVGG